jgi:hypothetical protein
LIVELVAVEQQIHGVARHHGRARVRLHGGDEGRLTDGDLRKRHVRIGPRAAGDEGADDHDAGVDERTVAHRSGH